MKCSVDGKECPPDCLKSLLFQSFAKSRERIMSSQHDSSQAQEKLHNMQKAWVEGAWAACRRMRTVGRN